MKDWPRVGNIGASDGSCGCTVFFFFFFLSALYMLEILPGRI